VGTASRFGFGGPGLPSVENQERQRIAASSLMLETASLNLRGCGLAGDIGKG
jgi:hypothetical protein